MMIIIVHIHIQYNIHNSTTHMHIAAIFQTASPTFGFSRPNWKQPMRNRNPIRFFCCSAIFSKVGRGREKENERVDFMYTLHNKCVPCKWNVSQYFLELLFLIAVEQRKERKSQECSVQPTYTCKDTDTLDCIYDQNQPIYSQFMLSIFLFRLHCILLLMCT